MVYRFDENGINYKTKLKEIIDINSLKKSEEGRKVRSSLYASDYGQCMRKIFFAFFPEEYGVEEIQPRTARIFQNGNSVHARLDEYLKMDLEIGFIDEVDVPRDDLDVHGRCDGICMVDCQGIVVEFKSINKDIVTELKEEHIGQISWYMHMWMLRRKDLKAELGYGEFDVITKLPEGLSPVDRWLLSSQGDIAGEIIYESKINNETYHFPVDYDASRVDKVKLWFSQVKWHVENKIAPEVKYKSGFFPCRWGSGVSMGKCPFYSVCWGKAPK